MSGWTWHGGGIEAARRHFGGSGWLDLSTGINPHPWPGADAVAIDWRRLPERQELAELETAAAAYFGLDPRHVCAVPGTEIGLRLAGRLLGGAAQFAAPSYRTHGEMIANAAPTDLDDADDGTLILANPNNPDGRVLAPALLGALLGRRTDDAWLLLDEAFADVDPALSLAGRIGDAHRLVIFRSFGKFFGLAGLRLGFVIGETAVLDRIEDGLGPWAVSGPALTIATKLMTSDTSAIRRSIDARKASLDATLSGAGLDIVGGTGLFSLVDHADAGALHEGLCRHHILVRPFDYNPRWLRFGLAPDGVADARLAAALTDVIG